jgi:hypothetical protein
MPEQHRPRRVILGALVALVAASVLGPGYGASAADDGARPRPDYGSKELFKLECELLGGTFSEDGIGNTNCHYPGGWVQCDANGRDCWHTPTSWQRPSGIEQTYGETVAEATTNDGGKETSTPALDSPTTAGAYLGVVNTDDQESKAKGKKSKKGKKGKKRGNGRK